MIIDIRSSMLVINDAINAMGESVRDDEELSPAVHGELRRHVQFLRLRADHVIRWLDDTSGKH